MTIPLSEQIEEAELQFLGIRDIHARAATGKIKRGEHEVERLAMRTARAEAVVCTLRALAKRSEGRAA